MRITLGVSLALVAVASVLDAKTVAWWPLAYESGVRTTVDSVLENRTSPGTLDAKPLSTKDGMTFVDDDSSTCPQGTNGFASGWGVWNPEDGAAVEAKTALYFQKTGSSKPAGALRVSDPGKTLQLQTMTFEAFFKMMPNPPNKSDWYCIAVMPGKLYMSDGQTKVKNYDSWGVRVIGEHKLQFRFTKPSAMAKDVETLDGADNQTLSIDNLSVYDGKWHHVAFVVSEKDKKAHVYYDYEYKNSVSLSNGLSYRDTDLYVGATPQTTGLFGGWISNVRISDKALSTSDFLQLTDLTVDPDVVLDADFETPEGMSFAEGAYVNKGYGSYVTASSVVDTVSYPHLASDSVPCATVYESLVASNGSANATVLENKQPSKGRTYAKFTPVGDDFTNSSFTVECHFKTTQSAQYIPLVRRRGGSNVQFNLGFGGTKGALSVTVLAKGNQAKQVNDTVFSNDGKWHHAALVVDAQARTLTLFRDYQKVGSNTFANEGSLVAGITPVCIAGVDNGNMFVGQIDNVRITMRALKVGEFIQSEHFVAGSDPTLAWASYEGSVDATGTVLRSGVASAATAGGTAPSFVEVPGRNPDIVNASGTVLKTGNVKALSFDKGVVKYPSNPLLPLLKNQTVEFFMKSGPQTQYTGIVRCNVEQNSADVPVWGLSFAESPRTAAAELRVRCSVRYASGTVENSAINEDTGIVVGDNRWHHIAMTIEESTTNDGTKKTRLSIYKDKSVTPDWTKEVSGELNYGSGFASVWLGASSSTVYYNGLLDELRISEGVVAPADFLRFAPNGMCVLIR